MAVLSARPPRYTRPMSDKVVKTDAEWQRLLTPEQYRVTRRKGTERAFTRPYWDHHAQGTYRCVCCGAELFPSDTKSTRGRAGRASMLRRGTRRSRPRSIARWPWSGSKSAVPAATPTSGTSSPMGRRPRACAIASTRRRSGSRAPATRGTTNQGVARGVAAWVSSSRFRTSSVPPTARAGPSSRLARGTIRVTIPARPKPSLSASQRPCHWRFWRNVRPRRVSGGSVSWKARARAPHPEEQAEKEGQPGRHRARRGREARLHGRPHERAQHHARDQEDHHQEHGKDGQGQEPPVAEEEREAGGDVPGPGRQPAQGAGDGGRGDGGHGAQPTRGHLP